MWYGPIQSFHKKCLSILSIFLNGNLGCDVVERVVLLFDIYEDNFKWRICGFSHFMSILAQWKFCCMLLIFFAHPVWSEPDKSCPGSICDIMNGWWVYCNIIVKLVLCFAPGLHGNAKHTALTNDTKRGKLLVPRCNLSCNTPSTSGILN